MYCSIWKQARLLFPLKKRNEFQSLDRYKEISLIYWYKQIRFLQEF